MSPRMSQYACPLCRFWPVNSIFWPMETLDWLFRHYPGQSIAYKLGDMWHCWVVLLFIPYTVLLHAILPVPNCSILLTTTVWTTWATQHCAILLYCEQFTDCELIIWRAEYTDLNNTGSRIQWPEVKPKKMTYLEYQDGGRSSFARCCRILRTVSKGNHSNKSLIIGFLLV